MGQTDDRRSAFSNIQQGGIIVVPWILGMEAGMGYDSLTQQLKGKAGADDSDVTWTDVIEGSLTYDNQIRRIESNEELSDSLEISASVNGSYGAFSTTATGKFLKSVSVTSYSVYFLIDSFVQNSEKVVTEFFLDESQLLLSADEFYRKYGDYYVSGVITGGSFISLLEMQTTTRDVKEQITVGLEANYDAKAFSVGGKFSTDIQNASKHTGVQLQIYLQEVGISSAEDEFKEGGTVDDLINASNNFPKRIKEAGKALYAILTPYSVLRKPPQIRTPINTGVVEALRQDMNAIYLRAKTILESVNYALSNSTQFNDDPSNLNQIKSKMEETLVKVANANNALTSGQDLDLVQKAIPEMPDLKLIPVRLWGGTKDVIAPPENVIPSIIRYKIATAYQFLSDLSWKASPDTENLRRAVQAYLDQVSNDLLMNFSNSKNLLTKLSDNMRILTGRSLPNATRSKLVGSLQNVVRIDQTFWLDAVANQKAMFAEIDTNEREKANLLQVIKDLNAQIWSTSETQYGGSAYWDKVAGIIDSLGTKVKMWDPSTKGDEYISFKNGEWKQLNDKFHDAMMNLHSSPVGS